MDIQNFVLLAAGRGSRLSELTSETPKPLLPIGGVPALQRILDHLVRIKNKHIVVVTGYQHDKLESFLINQYGSEVNIIFNDRYEKDTNILSVDLGVDALPQPEKGYTIIETDIILESEGWDKLLSLHQQNSSAWVTFGYYSTELTGAAIKVDENFRVLEIVYAPKYNEKYKNWSKMLGILKVGEREVTIDRLLRKDAIKKTIKQYYLMPWLENIHSLPCSIIDLSDFIAMSFNDLDSYNKTNEIFLSIHN
jgi:NDP-sugar pyrophosphorylase family protein